MRIFVGSDVHGSSANVERFFATVDAYRAQYGDAKVVLLGDIYNHCPRNPLPEGYAPMKVAERLNASKDYVTLVHGNCDSEVDQMITEFEIRPDFSLQWGERRLFFTHGHKCNPDLPCKDAKRGDVVFYGHFHKANVCEADGVIYVCVGAIGMPKADTVRSYAVVDEHEISVKSLVGEDVLFRFEI